MAYFPLKVSSKKQETPNCHTIVFRLPCEVRSQFKWFAGQFVKVKINIKGEDLVRSFSITSPPGSEYLMITVKANGEGGVSDYINQVLNVGERVQISAPLGKFYIEPDVNRHQTYYFFAAGSGITPLYNMMLTLLTQEPHSAVNLLYGTRSEKETIFWKQLAELHQRFEERFHLHYCFSETGWFGYSPWAKGHIDQEIMQRYIQDYPTKTPSSQVYLCGPGDFMDNLRQGLLTLGFDMSQIFYERFINYDASNEEVKGVAAELLVDLQGHEYRLQVRPDQTLLNVMKEAQLPVAYSCEAGVCGTCKCKLLAGQVTMLNNIALDDEQLKRNKILACQSIATSGFIKIRYV